MNCFGSYDLGYEISMPSPHYNITELKHKLKQAREVKKEMEDNIIYFDVEDIETITKLITSYETDLLQYIELMKKKSESLNLAASFCEQINERYKFVKKFNFILGGELEEYFAKKQTRLSKVATKMLSDALKMDTSK